ncbi:ribbon-helix-helix domain-containing protein [Bacteroidota bacterium]
MVMDTLQIRLSKGLVKRVDDLVGTGIYANRSDAIRDAVRRLVLDKLVGIIPNTGDSVNEVRETRNKLSKKIRDFNDVEEINKLID